MVCNPLVGLPPQPWLSHILLHVCGNQGGEFLHYWRELVQGMKSIIVATGAAVWQMSKATDGKWRDGGESLVILMCLRQQHLQKSLPLSWCLHPKPHRAKARDPWQGGGISPCWGGALQSGLAEVSPSQHTWGQQEVSHGKHLCESQLHPGTKGDDQDGGSAERSCWES